jgi:GAF domain-containing protein
LLCSIYPANRLYGQRRVSTAHTSPDSPVRPPREDLAEQLQRVRLESDTLYKLIGAIASAPDLSRVLESIVDLLTEATHCHACFVYLRDGSRLRLRAASKVYAHLVGKLEMGVDEGLSGWVARHNTPAFIRDNAFEDPRMKYFAELEEEHFQSMLAVPVPSRSGDVLGTVVLHTEAPHEFDEGVLNFLVHTASLVAGAIENARLYEETRRRVEGLTSLARLSQEIAAAAGREELVQLVPSGVRRLIGCELCQLYQLDETRGRLELASADPPDHPSPWPREGGAALLELLQRRAPRGARQPSGDGSTPGVLAVALTAGDEQLGALIAVAQRPFRDDDDEVMQLLAGQVALALQKAALIERLTEENIVRDLFNALAEGAADVAEARARAAGWDISRPHVFVEVRPLGGSNEDKPWPARAERVESDLRRLAPGTLCDGGRRQLRALLPIGRPHASAELEALDAALGELGRTESVAIGRSDPRSGARGSGESLREAADAAQIAHSLMAGEGGTMAYSELGAYRYLVRLPLDEAPHDAHFQAVKRLADYDRERRTQLVDTLERYLRDRRSIATTARALYVHPNTLRQRLSRIEELSGLELAAEDLLSLELAVKLMRLRG